MAEETIPLGTIFRKGKMIQFEWHLPPEIADLGEKLGEVIMQTIDAYFKEKGVTGGLTLNPKKTPYVA